MHNPTPISSAVISASMRNSIIAGSIGVFFFMVVQNGTVPLLLEKLGAGGIAIGLTSTLIQLGMLVQIPSSFFAERLVRRKTFWVWTNVLARSAIAVPGLYLLLAPDARVTAIWLMLAAVGVFSFFAQASAPTWFSWTADLVPDERRATFWARRQGYTMLVSVITISLLGWFLDLFPESSCAGFGWVLVAASFLGLMDIVVNCFVVEPPPSQANRTLSVRERIVRPLKDKDYRFFTLAMSVWFFGFGFFAPFQNVYLKTTFGVTYKHLSAFMLAGLISSVVSCFVGGRLIDRVGLRAFGVSMLMVLPLFSIPWFFLNGTLSVPVPIVGSLPQPVIVLCASALLAGGIYAAVGMLQLNLLSALSPKEGKTMAMAVHWTIVGALSALGPIAGGWVKDWFTAHPIGITLAGATELSYFHLMLLAHNLMIWGVMLPLLLKIRKRASDWHPVRAATHIFVGTPLRAVRSIYPARAEVDCED